MYMNILSFGSYFSEICLFGFMYEYRWLEFINIWDWGYKTASKILNKWKWYVTQLDLNELNNDEWVTEQQAAMI